MFGLYFLVEINEETQFKGSVITMYVVIHFKCKIVAHKNYDGVSIE